MDAYRTPKPYIWVPDPSYDYQARPDAPKTQEATEKVTLPQPIPVPKQFEPEPKPGETKETK